MATTSGANVIPAAAERKETPGPGRELYLMVCGGLLARRGLRFAPWCRSEALDEKRVRYALYGMTDNDEARELRRRAMAAAGLISADAAEA